MFFPRTRGFPATQLRTSGFQVWTRTGTAPGCALQDFGSLDQCSYLLHPLGSTDLPHLVGTDFQSPSMLRT